MIEVLHLFPKLNGSLIELMEDLSPAQWNSPTICKKWTVKDIAAHLLDTALRRVSSGRDDYFGHAPEILSYQDLLNFLNTLNAEWVEAYKRVSPQVLVSQMSVAQDQFYDYLKTLDLKAPALFPVSWAGEDESQNWFDVCREYTERWHHQQQIRLAVGAKSILDHELYNPFLNISMLALPFHYRTKSAPEGTVVTIRVVGDAGGIWSIVRNNNSWKFLGTDSDSRNQVFIDQNIAWMLLSKGLDIYEAEQYWQIIGDYELGFHALKMTAFMV
ncbi:maleylpyruvate isomerase family mycothiol-dependent enzyme [Daejeonella lutea]|uniref:TIGR03083 family protein n=1 Tax=Daejeonella lutea TaxID=572036 RepID=A0A1T5DTN5_9SPHI|nr:maleylpyruvate isomerase family mycothiol-dependent enzyme [Daejeonella lutea]SKB74890.1 TIGR03083 family protein [Daejeonella lutea]